MSILTTKNIFFFLVFINLNYILCEKSKCSTIEHCLKCNNENKCDKCEFGYRLNDDETKCERKKMIKRRLDKLNNSSSTENDTLENSTISKNEETNLTNSNCSSNKPSTSSNKEAESSKKSSASSAKASASTKKPESSNKSSASSNKTTISSSSFK